MKFDGAFDLDGVSPEEAWIVLSDPIAVRKALTGCRYIVRVDDDEGFDFDAYEPDEDVATLPDADPDLVAERAFVAGGQYAALLQLGVGSVKPQFESYVTIDEREFPRMVATGRGSASSSSFEMESGMEVSEIEGGTRVEWWASTDVSGRIAQLGSRVLNPVADKVVNGFFDDIQRQMTEVEASEESEGLTNRLRNLL